MIVNKILQLKRIFSAWTAHMKSDERWEVFCLTLETRQGYIPTPFLFSVVSNTVTGAIKSEEMKDTEMDKEEIKLHTYQYHLKIWRSLQEFSWTSRWVYSI